MLTVSVKGQEQNLEVFLGF